MNKIIIKFDKQVTLKINGVNFDTDFKISYFLKFNKLVFHYSKNYCENSSICNILLVCKCVKDKHRFFQVFH